jgi:Zinc carboxypeptidase
MLKRLIVAGLMATALGSPAAAQHALGGEGPYDPAVPTPASVLGYEPGERFTPHHLLMRYVEAVARASPRVRLDTVAHSFEGREVVLVIVSSGSNAARLEEIRQQAAVLADPRDACPMALAIATNQMPAIAWLGYTVHGPEASGAEAALAVIYQLAAGQDDETRRILENVVVLIDPLQNPDGHERHAQDVMRMRTALGVPTHPDARIHAGTWPGPRTSHYYFDLNRDWFTQSHPETRGRVQTMLRWWPQVVVDLHEMSYASTYFFPPPMAPINRLVDEGVRRGWDAFARGNIAAFDARGWAYFRREGYDEFYPGYGSSWPIYAGAVGMTYEQASSRGGAIRRPDGHVLTLREAAEHHYVASMATLSTLARDARARVADYAAYRRAAVQGTSEDGIRAVAFARDAEGRADSLARRLADNGIEVRRMTGAAQLRGTEYGRTGSESVRLPAGTYVVDLAQPQGRLARALLEPEAPLDSAFITEELERRRAGQSERFYDATGWAMPYAFRVRAWALPAAPGGTEPAKLPPPAAPPGEGRYGYAFAPGTEGGMKMLAALLRDSVPVMFAPRSFRSGGARFDHGAFVVRVPPNRAELHERVRRHAAETGAEVAALASGAADEGTDLGSNSVFPVRPPRVALLAGPPLSGQSFGYAWYAMDQRLAYPSTALEADAVAGAALDDFDVLIVPSASAGALSRVLGERGQARIAAWVRAGGVLVTVDAATDWLASEALGLSRLRTAADPEPDSAGAPLPAEVPGAIVRALADTLSPLLAGIDGGELPVLLFSDRVYRAPADTGPGEAVIRYAAVPRLRISGYLWPEVPARVAGTPYLWTESVGRGRVIGFAGDPNFRDMWRGLLPLFANAVFLGPSF